MSLQPRYSQSQCAPDDGGGVSRRARELRVEALSHSKVDDFALELQTIITNSLSRLQRIVSQDHSVLQTMEEVSAVARASSVWRPCEAQSFSSRACFQVQDLGSRVSGFGFRV